MASSILNRLAQIRRGFTKRKAKPNSQLPEHFERLRETDLLVASYPRSGNTWLRYLIADVVLQNAGVKTSTELPIHVDKIIPDLDRGDELESAERYCKNRILKTHKNCDPSFNKAVVIYRHPVDCLTSFFHFHLRYENLRPLTEKGIDQFCLERFVDWQQHLSSFHDSNKRSECKCLFMQYEQLHRNPVRQLSQALQFLELQHRIEHCEIAVANHRFAKHAKQEPAKQGTNEKFFRQGKVGGGIAELKASTVNQLSGQRSKLLKKLFSGDPTSVNNNPLERD